MIYFLISTALAYACRHACTCVFYLRQYNYQYHNFYNYYHYIDNEDNNNYYYQYHNHYLCHFYYYHYRQWHRSVAERNIVTAMSSCRAQSRPSVESAVSISTMTSANWGQSRWRK